MTPQFFPAELLLGFSIFSYFCYHADVKHFFLIKLKPVVRVGLFLQRLYWRIFRPHVRAGKCLIVFQDKVLLVRNRYGSGWWTLPGGSVRRRERPEEGLVREVREEVGIMLHDVCFLKKKESLRYGAPYILHLFSATVPSSALRVNRFEIKDAEWFSKDTLPENVAPIVVEALQAFDIA